MTRSAANAHSALNAVRSAVFDSASQLRSFDLFRAFWRSFAAYTRGRLWGALALILLIGGSEALGLLLLLPLLHAVGLGEVQPPSGWAALPLHALAWLGLPGTLTVLIATFVALKVVQALLRAYSGWVGLNIQTDYTDYLRLRLYRALVQANWLFVARQRSSDISHALVHEVPSAGSAGQQTLGLLGAGLMALAQIGVAFALSPAMTAMALATGAVFALGLRRLRRAAFEQGKRGFGTRAELTHTVNEHLAGIKLAKSQGREELHLGKFQQATAAIAAHMLRLYRFNAFTRIWLELGAVVAIGGFVWFAVTIGRVEPARLIVLAFAFSRLLAYANSLQDTWHQLTLSLAPFAIAERLRVDLEKAAEPPAPAVTTRLALQQELRLEHVSFSYDAAAAPAKAALRDVNLVMPARRATALCGPSGAGKSTLADLALGLLMPTDGRILIDGHALAGPRLHDWRRSIAYVPQDTFLFHDTIRQNLLWAEPSASEADLLAALRAAAAEEFVRRLPQGLDTLVGDRGLRLSGGERQRIALARALLRRPTLLVLDEATSALDTQNERLVQDAIEKLAGELTLLLIAHRLSTVRMADNIVVLNRGSIVETGSWDTLSQRDGGAFRQLIEADQDRP